MKTNVSVAYRIGFAILLALLVMMLFLYAFFISPKVMIVDNDGNELLEDRSYHFVIVGRSQDESFLTDIYNGAQEMSADYDCVVELNISKSMKEQESIQGLLDYAAFANADGVIACMSENDSGVSIPVNMYNETIPLVTVSQYLPSVSQISYIGTNFSELGRKLSFECSTYLKGKGSLVILNANTENNPNYSILMSSLINSLGSWRNISSSVIEVSSSEEINRRNSLVEKKIKNESVNLIVCLSAEDTIHAAQLVTDMGIIGKIGIIGFGEGSVVERYLENGIVTELLSIDSEKIGRSALKELFEYINYGYANSYITSDVRVKKAESI